MRKTRLSWFLLAALASLRGLAAPQPGAALPALAAGDVTGQRQELAALIRGPTLVVAITDRHAGDAMRAWFAAADTHAPRVNRISIISVGVPFFVSDGYARSKAREEVPRQWWHATLFDSNHAMAHALGLDENAIPYVFALSGDGRVLAAAHTTAADPQAQKIWGALRAAGH